MTPKNAAPALEGQTLEIGRILRAHGLRGDLKVEPYWLGSDSLITGRSVWILTEGAEARALTVEAVRVSGRFALVKLQSIDDRDAADAVRGSRLGVERASLPELDPGEYYLVDLVGAEVTGPEGRVGEVVDVRAYPSVDALVVKLADGRLAEQPISAPFVEMVDAARKLVVLANTDGLIT